MARLRFFSAIVVIGVAFGCRPANSWPGNTPRVVVVKGSLNTTANSGPGGQVVNIDGVGGPALPFDKVKRYTVAIQTALLSTAPVGVDRIEVFVGVLTGTTAADLRVILQDPATASPMPSPGLTVLPYAGTNSYIRITRGADGLGPVEVRFNAYVEVEP